MQLADLDLNKTYTYADYYKWKFEERIELIKGYIYKMSPAANRVHQEIVGYTYRQIGNFLEGKQCKVYVAPFDVRFPRKSHDDKDIITVLQPDVCVVCDPAKLDIKGCLGAPDIVVEVLSPGNNTKELRNKYDVYEEAGVAEYWIISPQDETFILNTLVDGKYVASRIMSAGDLVHSNILPGFSLDLQEMFARL